MDLNTNVTVQAKYQRAESKPYPGFLQAVWLAVLQKLTAFLIYISILIAGITIDRNSIFRLIIPACAMSVVLWYGQKKATVIKGESHGFFRQLAIFD
jgi:hypothetical protein